MWVLRWDHHPFAIPALRAAIRTLLLALIQFFPPQLRRGQHEACDGCTLSWRVCLQGFKSSSPGQQTSSISQLSTATARGKPARDNVATRQTSGLS